MRYIKKEFSGEGQLGRHHATPPQNSDDANKSWANFPNGKQVLALLLEEQFFVAIF
jgi:hypothetical protein